MKPIDEGAGDIVIELDLLFVYCSGREGNAKEMELQDERRREAAEDCKGEDRFRFLAFGLTDFLFRIEL